MIVGIGTDLCLVSRIGQIVERRGQRFLDRCFTSAEQLQCGNGPVMAKRYATRFAAKEACMKAFGLGWAGGLRFVDIGVEQDARGKPSLRLTGYAEQLARQLGVTGIHLSLSHEGDMALAVVILEA
ncbi:MAG: holo-ACP synthase [candidate division WS1 bacterium]|nr:holo-ACP synthase [candidate division WS1 bacterium]